MQIADGREGLTKKLEALGLTDNSMLILVGKESSILGQLHHHVYRVILNECVPKLDDMRMVNSCV